MTYSAALGLGRHTAALLAEEGGPQKAVTIGLYQILGYRISSCHESLKTLANAQI